MNEHPLKGRQGLRRIVKAAGYSAKGLRDAWKHESAFRQEVWLAVPMMPLSLWMGTDWVERVLLIGSVGLVLIVELLNSAIEAAVDRVSLDLHPLAGRAKDMGSAAVMLALLLCAGVWASAIWARWA